MLGRTPPKISCKKFFKRKKKVKPTNFHDHTLLSQDQETISNQRCDLDRDCAAFVRGLRSACSIHTCSLPAVVIEIPHNLPRWKGSHPWLLQLKGYADFCCQILAFSLPITPILLLFNKKNPA
jgi:hypothetical protein